MAASSPTKGFSGEELKSLSKLSAGNVEFTKQLYNILSRKPGNIICSPICLELAILLAYVGARGSTADEIKNAFLLPDSKDDVLQGVGALMKLLKLPTKVTLNIANGIFIDDTLELKDSYVKSTMEHFSASPRRIDIQKPSEAAKIINDFVDRNTNHKITEIISPCEIARVHLVNAVYFKGNWMFPFEPRATYKGVFHVDSNTEVKTDFMMQQEYLQFAENKELNATVLKLPYDGGDVSMVLLIPKEVDGLQELERKFKDLDLVNLTSDRALHFRDILLHFPKFELEKTLDLETALNELGMREMFTRIADFKDLADIEELGIRRVRQKAYIKVDEKGTEAAAATEIIMADGLGPPLSKEVKADRPFMFYIFEQSSGLPIFIGRFCEITQQLESSSLSSG